MKYKKTRLFSCIFLMVCITSFSIQYLPIRGNTIKIDDLSSSLSSSTTQDVFWPSNSSEWTLVAPEEQGLNSSKISEIFELISSEKHNIQSIIIVRNGYLLTYEYLYESEIYRYIDGTKTYSGGITTRQQFSTTKSLISILIGIAIQEGFLDNVNQTLYEFFADIWEPSFVDGELKKNITIEQLLTMTSGIGGEPFPSDSLNKISDDVIKFILSEVLLGFTPGAEGEFLYSNEGVDLLSGIITNVTGKSTEDFADEYLFTPLGISKEEGEWAWLNDSKEINYGGSGFRCSPKVQAKIGMLALNNGSWNGQQIADLNFMKNATTHQVGEDGGKYGYLWWIMDSNFEGFEGFAAMGAEGQCIYVLPQFNIVAAFTGYQIGETYEQIISDYILQFVDIEPDPDPEDPVIPGFNLNMIFLMIFCAAAVLITKRNKQT